MNLPAANRRVITAPRWAVVCGVALASGFVMAQGPAARLGEVRPSGSIVARAGSPTNMEPPSPSLPYKPSIFETFEDQAKAKNHPTATQHTSVPMSQAAAGTTPVKPKTFWSTNWDEFKALMGQKSSESTIPVPPPSAEPAKLSLSEPVKTVYTGPPAYRWYGWGTTTPGLNPYAPTGQYPQASANWYAQTGATPGAFPAPFPQSVHLPANEPPRYTSPYANQLMLNASHDPAVDLPRRTRPQPVRTPSKSSPHDPSPTNASPAMESPPSIELPPPQGLIPVPAGPSSLFLSPPSLDVDVQWMPVNSQSKPRSELLPAAGWTSAESTLEERIRQACQKTADVLAVIPHGPHKLTVRLLARSESHARVAADEVVRLPELHGYEISFEAKFRDP